MGGGCIKAFFFVGSFLGVAYWRYRYMYDFSRDYLVSGFWVMMNAFKSIFVQLYIDINT